ncbi:MAG: NAD-dependent epimerase/dehydratase family protein [Dehalococcoidia bacterium]|nr:NAD-dependent epimerase/dehydratase family protein [Dehalococcoidia bacterium]
MTGTTLSNDIVRQAIADICAHLGERAQVLSDKTIVITGGAGFICSYFLDVLCCLNDCGLSPPCHVASVDNYSTGAAWRLAHLRERGDVSLIEADISKDVPLPQTIHYIIHGASIASPVVYRRYPIETIKVNVLSTWHLLKRALKGDVKSLLYLSSSEIYGDPTEGNVPTPESYHGNVSSTGPRACYDESKRLAETLCMTYYRHNRVPVKIVRPFNVYGPRLSLDDGRIIPDLLNNALNGQPLTLYSDGRSTRSFCYISDAICAMLDILLSGHNGEVFNVGNDEEVSIRQVAEEIDHQSGHRLGIEYRAHEDTDYLKDNPQRRCPDLSKAKRLIDYQPQVNLASGLARTLKWHQENRQ